MSPALDLEDCRGGPIFGRNKTIGAQGKILKDLWTKYLLLYNEIFPFKLMRFCINLSLFLIFIFFSI